MSNGKAVQQVHGVSNNYRLSFSGALLAMLQASTRDPQKDPKNGTHPI